MFAEGTTTNCQFMGAHTHTIPTPERSSCLFVWFCSNRCVSCVLLERPVCLSPVPDWSFSVWAAGAARSSEVRAPRCRANVDMATSLLFGDVVVRRFEGKHFIPTWESLPLKWYLFRLLTQVYHSASVTFLPGYTPSPEEQQNPVLYADNVRSLMSQHSGIPMATANHHFKWALHKQMLAKTKPLKWQWHRNETVQDPRTFATASWEVETKPSISAPSDIESVPTVLAASTVPCCAEAMQPRAQGDDAGRLAPPLPVVSATSTDDESTASPEEVGVAVNVPAAAAAHHPNGTPIVPPEPVVAAADADPTRAAEARDVRQVEGSNSLGAEPTETVRHTVDVASHVPV